MKLLTTLAAASALAIATPALAGNHSADGSMTKMSNTAEFTSYDANNDGRVDFAEYSKWAKKDGLSTTAAAQRFVKMSGGNSYLDRGSFDTAMTLGASYYDTQPYMGRTSIGGATYIGNTAVLGQSVDSNGNIILPRSNSATTSTITNSSYSSGLNSYSGTMSTGSLPRATVDPMYRPEDKVGGDLTQTRNPIMDVRPDTVNTMSDDFGTVDIDTSSTISIE